MTTTVACGIGKHKFCDGVYTDDQQHPKGKCECPCHGSERAGDRMVSDGSER